MKSNQNYIFPDEIWKSIFEFVPEEHGSWSNILSSSKLFNKLGLDVFLEKKSKEISPVDDDSYVVEKMMSLFYHGN